MEDGYPPDVPEWWVQRGAMAGRLYGYVYSSRTMNTIGYRLPLVQGHGRCAERMQLLLVTAHLLGLD